MAFRKARNFKKSVFCAWRGLLYACKNERNFRIELVLAIFVISFSFGLGISYIELILVFMVIAWVLSMELINTSMERVVDILEPKIHPYAKLIKDTMATVVLISAIISLVIGLIIFIPYILEVFSVI